MMTNCEKASELTSKKIDITLSFFEKISLKFHTLMCSTCTLFEDEANTLTKVINQNQEENKISKTMSRESRDRLQELVVSKING